MAATTDNASTETDVLIAGAGPTGLLLAGELTRRGVDCTLIDAHDAPLGWDRATVVHPRSLEIFESLGLVDPFLARGVKVLGARFHSGGKVLGVLDFTTNGSRYGFDIGISEDATEAVLTNHLEDIGGTVTRSTRLVDIQADDDEQVVATIEGPEGRRRVTASWLVGCDGFHSTVRRLAGVGLSGEDIKAPWAVFDATLEGWESDYDFNAGHFEAARPVILTPLPGRRWRVYLQPASDSSDLEADALEVLDPYTPGLRITDVENPARFRCHSTVADRFRAGRVLLAGDAAHACSPTEGHGMNTGLQDAFNLGWKLALVCKGVSGSALLDSYEPERRPVAMRVVESGSGAEQSQAMKTPDERAARDAEIAMTFGIDGDHEAAKGEAVALAELDRSYADSPIVSGEPPASGLPPGALFPDDGPVHLAGGGSRLLHELAHRPEHTVLVVAGEAAESGEVGRVHAAIEDAVGGSPLVGAAYALSSEGEGDPGTVGRIDGSTAERLGVDGVTVLAIRPDRYVGYRGEAGAVEGLRAYLDAVAA